MTSQLTARLPSRGRRPQGGRPDDGEAPQGEEHAESRRDIRAAYHSRPARLPYALPRLGKKVGPFLKTATPLRKRGAPCRNAVTPFMKTATPVGCAGRGSLAMGREVGPESAHSRVTPVHSRVTSERSAVIPVCSGVGSVHSDLRSV